jgi:hypothetical protein
MDPQLKDRLFDGLEVALYNPFMDASHENNSLQIGPLYCKGLGYQRQGIEIENQADLANE